ncbi:MAG: bifunctional serine/threonine-protein kinase/formylglycine-generating enzyme family protein [Myxococcota bacterium]|nr:bifunctional serine/threonine-protein kinase/formylglycine-generating enzyme family protein [Myxococcota bacterium]
MAAGIAPDDTSAQSPTEAHDLVSMLIAEGTLRRQEQAENMQEGSVNQTALSAPTTNLHESSPDVLNVKPFSTDVTQTIGAADALTARAVIDASYPQTEPLTERYEKLGELGAGGMGRVLKVKDKLLNRVLAMKVIHGYLFEHESNLQRFVQEAQVCAQLQHPNILPIYDIGILDSGPIFITMMEIKGDSLHQRIQAVHAASSHQSWQDTEDGWNLHRLVSAFHDVCKAVSHAHENGVVHRDLKPKNIMIGPFGEVLVVDWGLAKVIEADELNSSVNTIRSTHDVQATAVGSIYGTPAYIAPELATGEVTTANRLTDIYALGVILYEILRGQAAYSGQSMHQILMQVVTAPQPGFESVNASSTDNPTLENELAEEATYVTNGGAPIPGLLVEMCTKAMARDPLERFKSASEMVEMIGQWLDGSRRREKALELVGAAKRLEQDIRDAELRATDLLVAAQASSTGTLPWQSDTAKLDAWHKEDEATALLTQSMIKRTEKIQLYRAALAHKDDLVEAHIALATYYKGVHQAAEEDGDSAEAKRSEIILREHVKALPLQSDMRHELTRYLDGSASLNVCTSPSGASIRIVAFRLENRRLKLDHGDELGTSPLRDHPLQMGSYLLKINKAGYHEAIYPVYNRRLNDVSGQDPEGGPFKIELLPLGTLGPDDCYVPGGWCRLGGDRQTPNSLNSTVVWVDGFVMRRFPVTHEEYLNFLNELVSAGRVDQALNHVPREQSSTADELGAMAYAQTPNGSFELPHDPEREICWPNQPVTMIQWRSAVAYADWLAKKTGMPWRLPMEFEWEKAARGVDGRFYPWGNDFDPSWACMKDSHPDKILMQEVDTFPADESVYGVRGTAGNTRDWCLDRFRESGPPLKNGRLVMPTADDLTDTGFKSSRGGSYGNSASRSRSGDRDWWFPERSYIGRGFRLAWGLSDRTSCHSDPN